MQCSKAAHGHRAVWSLLPALDGAKLQEASWRWLYAVAHCSNLGLQTADSLQSSAERADAKLKLAEKQALLEAKQKKAAEKQKKHGEVMQDLAEKAQAAILKDPAGKPCFENLQCRLRQRS